MTIGHAVSFFCLDKSEKKVAVQSKNSKDYRHYYLASGYII